jgi:streptogramin lyase
MVQRALIIIGLLILVISSFYSCNKEVQYIPHGTPYQIISQPYDLVIDKTGNLYFTNGDKNILKVTSSGAISSFAGTDTIRGCDGFGGPATSAHFTYPTGITMDAAGNIYFSDAACEHIEKVNTSTGILSLVAGNGYTGNSGDGGFAISAELNSPASIITDTSGNVYFAEIGNDKVRMINNKTGIITTIAGNGNLGFSGDGGPATAAELDDPWGVAVDDSGNVYISDAENGRIRKVNASTGIINTLISTIAPGSLVLDSAKNLYFVNHIKSIVNKLNYQTKAITTIAGSGTQGYNGGDGGPATSAELGTIFGITLDKYGNLYIADLGNNNIREVNLSTGIISTVAHN